MVRDFSRFLIGSNGKSFVGLQPLKNDKFSLVYEAVVPTNTKN